MYLISSIKQKGFEMLTPGRNQYFPGVLKHGAQDWHMDALIQGMAEEQCMYNSYRSAQGEAW